MLVGRAARGDQLLGEGALSAPQSPSDVSLTIPLRAAIPSRHVILTSIFPLPVPLEVS